ncbi:hypothetical protein GCM10011351_27000 [Paraliobacillus quinghaiensis]|uniref:Restriction endonuclease n=1 Tax=Paraliobacillus quinghaiensis TaxID=470815 RepID=A0A917TVH5_9BACI|nr:AlwI family type II restriction endonuclease [Paraliobacillus quinghaiensis]GGM39434.1 hypothetical protein GCM10011351_27000 [Paraliobacillus quinghaiensis]
MRKVWFITRPERDPKFHVDALRALKIATDDFSIKWYGNREAHKQYESVLINHQLKRENISNDGSGGRTWAAMLRTFGYIYLNQYGYLVLTKVGEKLLNSVKIRENISKQILTLQIPNAYFLDSGFRPKFVDEFQIRPARFLIRLVNQSILDFYITKEEITFFALTAKNDGDVHMVTNKILDFRKASDSKKHEMKKSIAINYDHRQRSDSEARNFAFAHGDVAHTFMLLCDYTGLVDYVRGDALRLPTEKQSATLETINYFDDRYPFNKRYLISLERFAENAGLDVDSYKASTFGSLPPATNKNKSLKKVQRLLSSYPMLKALSIDEITKILEQELSTNEAKKYAYELYTHTFEFLNEDFVESYLYEENDRTFEDKTGEILRSIGFEVEMRPKPLGEDVRTEIEILVHIDNETICIIDAKNYKEKFTLSANLASHMSSEYIPNYHGYKGKSVKYFGYVTANKYSGERQLEKICDKAAMIDAEIKVFGAIFSAKAILGFLDYCLENGIEEEERVNRFISLFINKGYESVAQII